MKYLVILFAIGLSACASKPNFPQAGIGQTYEILGATISSPNEPNWYLMQHDQMGIFFGKEMTSKTDSLIANAWVFGVGGHEDDDSFFDYVIAERERNDDKTRFVDRGVKNNRATLNGSACIKYDTIAEDHASKSKSSQPFQYFSTMGYICRHPGNKSVVIQLEVSYRSDLQNVPDGITLMSDQFFNSLEFINNKVK